MPPKRTKPQNGVVLVQADSETSDEAKDNLVDAFDNVLNNSTASANEAPGINHQKKLAYMFMMLLLGGAFLYVIESWKWSQEQRAMGSIPRLAHVVEETQGFRKPNLLGLGIMFLSSAFILFGTVYFRRYRHVMAKKHDTVFWMLSALACFFTTVFLFHGYRRRRETATRALARKMSSKTSYAPYYAGGSFLATLLGLLWYRRRKHIQHVKRRKRHREEMYY